VPCFGVVILMDNSGRLGLGRPIFLIAASYLAPSLLVRPPKSSAGRSGGFDGSYTALSRRRSRSQQALVSVSRKAARRGRSGASRQ
jgi:hypothetical protein